MEDIVLIDKPENWTSFDVVAKIRSQIRAGYVAKGIKPTKRQLKVGHAGTLDPFATGLLIILLGDRCSEADRFLKLDKMYEFTAVLGTQSSTGDPEGSLTAMSSTVPTASKVSEVISKFIGKIQQVPPAYSAIKIDGKRAYKLAREGKAVDLPPREVEIISLEVIDYAYPELKCRVHVSSGTYIRSLVEDIGKALETGAYCSQLRRTQVGKFDVKDSKDVSSFSAGA